MPSLVIITSLVEGVQVPLEMVQRKVAVLVVSVTEDVGDDGFATLAVPETTNHWPVPIVGAFAARVVVAVQIS